MNVDESDFEYIIRAVSDSGSGSKKSQAILEAPSNSHRQKRLDVGWTRRAEVEKQVEKKAGKKAKKKVDMSH